MPLWFRLCHGSQLFSTQNPFAPVFLGFSLVSGAWDSLQTAMLDDSAVHGAHDAGRPEPEEAGAGALARRRRRRRRLVTTTTASIF
eukprot:2434735-Rhodomonas_salina.1